MSEIRAGADEETSVLSGAHLDSLVGALRQCGYEVIAPVRRDGAIVYERILAADELPIGWTDRQEAGRYRLLPRDDGACFGYNLGPRSWKQYLHQPRRLVWKSRRSADGIHFEESAEDPEPLAFLGVRGCELHALSIQDRVFSTGEHHNDDYLRRRGAALIVAVECTTAVDTCFCTSMHTGPEVGPGFDIKLVEVIAGPEHYFLVQSGSHRGAAILEHLSLTAATPAQLQRGRAAVSAVREQLDGSRRAFDSSGLQELMYRNYENPHWETIAERCLSCANCTLVCPTCFCSTNVDTTDLTGDNSERWQYWDSCFNSDFAHVHGGSVRAGTAAKYRQWLTHKLATWQEQFGSSGCVGCGRCISWCPVGIDITEEVRLLRESEQP